MNPELTDIDSWQWKPPCHWTEDELDSAVNYARFYDSNQGDLHEKVTREIRERLKCRRALNSLRGVALGIYALRRA